MQCNFGDKVSMSSGLQDGGTNRRTYNTKRLYVPTRGSTSDNVSNFQVYITAALRTIALDLAVHTVIATNTGAQYHHGQAPTPETL